MDLARERVVELRVPRRALGPRVLAALERLGYRIVPAGGGRRRGDASPDVVLAAGRDVRRLRGERGDARVIAVSRRGEELGDGPAPATWVRRPAHLAELYAALQRVLERHPRRTPRISTRLPARCVRGDYDWPGAVVSLSEGGCLLRAARQPAGRAPVRVWFPLPDAGLLEVTARPLYRREGQVGLAFEALGDRARAAIGRHVERGLLS